MERIGNADRLVLMLRQRLKERASAAKTRDSAAGAASRRRPAGALERVQALGAADGDERHLRRTLVETLLNEQLGDSAVNDAQFQQMVDRVAEAIEEDRDSAR